MQLVFTSCKLEINLREQREVYGRIEAHRDVGDALNKALGALGDENCAEIVV